MHRNLGYTEIWSYSAGIDFTEDKRISKTSTMNLSMKPMGWAGNRTGMSPKKVLEKISVVKSIDDCHSFKNSYVWYKPNNTNVEDTGFELMKFELTRGLYPNPTCCKVIDPVASKNYVINGFSISFNGSNNQYKSFKIIVSDKVSSSVFKQHNTNVLGDEILTPKDENGFLHYKIKIAQEIHLEDDPNYSCINYKTSGNFHHCLENEIIKENMKILNCTPPWMTDDEGLWCQGNLTLESQHEILDWNRFVANLNFGQANYDTCSVPCKTSKYYVNEFGFKADSQLKGVMVVFDKVVKQTISELQIGPRTLVTRFGGIIGVGKNLSWVLIFILSAVGFCSSKQKKIENESETEV